MQLENFKTLLPLNTESKCLHNVMRIWDFENIIWPQLNITGLSNISITCSPSMISLSGEKALKFKGTVKWKIKWMWSSFSGLILFEFINHDKVTFFSARTSPYLSYFPHQVKHVHFPDLSMMCSWVIAHVHAITHTNQEKGSLGKNHFNWLNRIHFKFILLTFFF